MLMLDGGIPKVYYIKVVCDFFIIIIFKHISTY